MPVFNPISVDTTQASGLPPISVDVGTPQIAPLPIDIIESRADKAAFALNQPLDPIKYFIADGQEDQVRQQESAKIAQKQNQTYLNALGEASRKKGGPLTSEELYQLNDYFDRQQKFNEPRSVFEYNLAKKYYDTLYQSVKQMSADHWYDDVLKAMPKEELDISGIGKTYLAQDQYLLTKRQNYEAIYNKQSYPGWFWDKAKDFLTLGFHSEYTNRGLVPGVSFFSGLLGTNVDQQRMELRRKPFDEFKNIVDQLDQVVQDNPSLAIELVDKLLGNTDVGLNNLFSGITLFTPPGSGVLAKKGISLLTGVKNVTKDIARSAAHPESAKVLANSAAGNLEEAAVQKTLEDNIKDIKGTSNPIQQIFSRLPDALNVQLEGIKSNPGNYKELVNRMELEYGVSKSTLYQLIEHISKVQLLPGVMADEAAQRQIVNFIKSKYPELSNSVLDTKIHYDPNFNTHWGEMVIGKPDATYFTREEQANAFAYINNISLAMPENMAKQVDALNRIKLYESIVPSYNVYDPITKELKFPAELKAAEQKLLEAHKELSELRSTPGAHIKNDGLGFYISKFVPIPYNAQVIRDVAFETATKTPEFGIIKSVLGWIRTPEETFSKDAARNAKVATYAPSSILEMMRDEMKEINSLKRSLPGTTKRMEFNSLRRAMEYSTERGSAFISPQDLSDFYLRTFDRTPSEREVSAYFAWRRFEALRKGFQDLRGYTNDVREGAESHFFTAKDRDGNRIQSPTFTGTKELKLPSTDENILIPSSVVGHEVIRPVFRLSKAAKFKLDQGLLSGRFSLIKLTHPETNPLQGFGKIDDSYIKYVIHDSMETRPLSIKFSDPNQIAKDLDYSYSIKQAIVKKDKYSNHSNYLGDRTVMHVDNSAIGNNIIKTLENVRNLIRDGKEEEAKIAARSLAIEWRDHLGWYKDKVDDLGKPVASMLDMSQQLRLVPRGKRIIDLDNTLESKYGQFFRDRTRGPDFKNEPDKFEVFTAADKGTRNNPLYTYAPTRMVDPIPSMNRGMTRLINSAYLEDYKQFATQQWIKEATVHLAADPNDVNQSPLWHFYNTKLRPGTTLDVRNRLESNRFKIKQILGTPGPLDTFLHNVSQNMAASVYEGKGLAGYIPRSLDPSWMIPKINDAASMLKFGVYHATMGIFALPQLLVQNMTYATIYAVGGVRNAVPGSAAAFFHQLSRMNPSFVDTFDRILTHVGWKPGEFTEAYTHGKNSGFFIVGSEHALSSNPFSTNVITSFGKDTLDLGTVFFREGDRNVRFGAWYTAFKEWRNENPFKKIGLEERNQIFDRAELMSGNMSSASKSLLQRGPLSFTTQFMSYNMRLAELMSGHRLTTMEKARMIGTYWGLFGVSAAGLYGFPWDSIFRQKLIEHGYIAEDSQPTSISNWLVEGLPSAALHWATGRWTNIPQRFGSPSFDIIRDIMAGDKPLWNLALGPTGNTMYNVWELSDGMRTAMASLFRDDPDSKFNLKGDDLIEPLKAISSFNMGVRALAAINTGNWNSRKGQTLAKGYGPTESLLMSAAGLQPLAVADLRNMQISTKDRETLMKHVEDEFLKEYRRATQAINEGNYQQADAYFKRAKAQLVVGNYPIEKYGELATKAALESINTVVDKSKYNYYLSKNIPLNQRQQMRDTYSDRVKILQGQ